MGSASGASSTNTHSGRSTSQLDTAGQSGLDDGACRIKPPPRLAWAADARASPDTLLAGRPGWAAKPSAIDSRSPQTQQRCSCRGPSHHIKNKCQSGPSCRERYQSATNRLSLQASPSQHRQPVSKPLPLSTFKYPTFCHVRPPKLAIAQSEFRKYPWLTGHWFCRGPATWDQLLT